MRDENISLVVDLPSNQPISLFAKKEKPICKSQFSTHHPLSRSSLPRDLKYLHNKNLKKKKRKLQEKQTCSRDEKLSGINEYFFFILSLAEEMIFSLGVALAAADEVPLVETEDACLDIDGYL